MSTATARYRIRDLAKWLKPKLKEYSKEVYSTNVRRKAGEADKASVEIVFRDNIRILVNIEEKKYA